MSTLSAVLRYQKSIISIAINGSIIAPNYAYTLKWAYDQALTGENCVLNGIHVDGRFVDYDVDASLAVRFFSAMYRRYNKLDTG